MNTPDHERPIPPSGAFPLAGATAAEETEQLAAGAAASSDLPKVKPSFIALLGLAVFGAYLAFVTPIAISLAIQVKAIAPQNEEYLGVILGVGALAGLIVGPLVGQLSDRTRSRLGRRRPWIIIGAIVGFAGLTVMAAAPTVVLLGAGWVVAVIGWNAVVNTISTIQADRIPEYQRGRVGAITGFANMVAPIFGAIIGGLVATQPYILFLLPGVIAIVLVLIFVAVYNDGDSRQLTVEGSLSAKTVLSKYVFNPKRYPDFSWNWLARFLFFFGLTLNTSFTAYFFSSRLDIPVEEIGGTVAAVGGIGIVGTIIGVFAGGFLSDKFRRRKLFVLSSGILFGVGALVMVVAPDLPLLIVGSFLGNLAIGIFSAVDQALVLDVLPERDSEAGRFINITQFSVGIPQALAPLVAAVLLSLTAVGDQKNYSVLYILAAVLTVAGGAMVLRVKSVR